MIDEEIKLIRRKVHYHELHFEFKESFKPREDGNQFLGFFSEIAKLATTKDKLRYQPIGESLVFVQDVKFSDAEKKITGKLRSIRQDVFPEIMNMTTDEAREIIAEQEEGIVETTHFIIDYSKPTKRLAVEFNHVGAKIGEFITYCENIANYFSVGEDIKYIPIARNELSKYKERMNRFSQIIIRVHKDNVAEIEKMDEQVYSAIKQSIDQFDAEYAELKLKFSYRKAKGVQKISESVTNLITSLIADKKRVHLFDKLKVKAQDSDNNLRLKLFDLLIDKVESEIDVQRKPKHKTIISEDIYEKMIDAMRSKRF